MFATSDSCNGVPPKLRYASRFMKCWSRLSRYIDDEAGGGSGTHARPPATHGARAQGELMVVSVSAIDGVVPHVTATLAESRSVVVEGSGPRTNSASPAGGGWGLSMSATRKPYCGCPPYCLRSALNCRAVCPLSILSRSKT